ncbi:MAG: leucine-rich repeat protein [Lachnospiraceae bacterium]|nr:leucine-rich repeat protein [Lachnospiraceae bacterium]
MPFTYKKTEYRRETCIEITGFEGTVRTLTLPDRIDGLPVRSIGKHAFAGRKDVQEVSLPQSLRRLSLFAFHNCSRLSTMSLFDSVDDYYDGVIRQCGALEEITIRGSGGTFALMKEMLEDNDRAMSFHLYLPEEEIRLSFPDYALIASENTMARTIQFAYEGGGYAYRNCVRKKEIRFREYDRLFPFMEHDDPDFAAVIASDRLLYSHDLDPSSAQRYTAFLKDHAADALKNFIRKGQMERVRLITENGLADGEALSEALKLASERKETAICAVLMEGGRDSAGKGQDLSLQLDDWDDW